MPTICRRLATWLALSLCCATLAAQSATPLPTSPNDGPWSTVSEGADDKLMLFGHDPVAYFTMNDAVRGDPAISLVYRGVTWRFANEAHRAAFQREPERYLPQFGGFCTNGLNYAIPWGTGGGPNTWRIYHGRLYVFGGQASRDQFELDTARNLALAHQYWNDEVAGSNAWLKRWQRIVFRVPHYKTGDELAAEWEARRAAGTLPVMPGAPQDVPAAAPL